jgi:hypothetical protein
MLRFIDNVQCDAAGNSLPGAYRLTDAEVASALADDAKRHQLTRIAAAADDRLATRHFYGLGYKESDFEDWATGKSLTTTQRMEAKRLITDFGLPIDQVAQRLRV